jgi:hypothetical protein
MSVIGLSPFGFDLREPHDMTLLRHPMSCDGTRVVFGNALIAGLKPLAA